MLEWHGAQVMPKTLETGNSTWAGSVRSEPGSGKVLVRSISHTNHTGLRQGAEGAVKDGDIGPLAQPST